MTDYIGKAGSGLFNDSVARIVEPSKTEGFRIVADIGMNGTTKKKFNLDCGNYRTLGAYDPPLAQ